jgi:M6 family metalloprotease-like protein
MPPKDGSGSASLEAEQRFREQIDMPNPLERAQIKTRMQWRQAQRVSGAITDASSAPPSLSRKSGTDRVLVLLVEFVGTNTFTWTPGVSTWDPLGRCDNSEFDGAHLQNTAASQYFAQKYGITGPTNFTYTGPLHNEIARPVGGNDPSATMIWQPDFAPSYYSNIIFGAGIAFDYTRQDGSAVREDYNGYSVRDYYEDLSSGAYTITGSILGWLKVPNSVWYYGGDGLPGARSCPQRPDFMGAIPGGGDSRTLVIDALLAAKAAYPALDWASFDQDGDGLIDRLWIIHAGLGEEDNPALLNRTSYGEGGMWSHSWSLGSPFEVVPGVSALSFIMMPENAGIAVLSHEFAHNLGAMDLYTYGDGQTSAGFWTLMSDSWVGFPLGFLPEGMDPMHLDEWGWLDPFLITDATKVYSVNLGQASQFPVAPNRFRAAKIELAGGVNGSTHNYYLQWRNTSISGGYDQALGDTRFRFGPAGTGLIVWYQDDRYWDNSILNHLKDPPSFGPKGKLLVVDAHPEPEMDPYWVARGITDERGIVFSRGSMRDAAFSRWQTASHHLDPPYAFQPTDFPGRPAVPLFSDAVGYYPGIELVGTRWRTRQWDASVVIPAKNLYGVRGPGYPVGGSLDQIIASRSFVGTSEMIAYRTNVISGGLTQAGSDGNPGTFNAAFGWNACVVWQTNQEAEVVIWNDQFASLDDDHDGVPNWEEALAGTDPKDPTSYLRVTRVEPGQGGAGIWLEWTSATNRTYRVVRTSSLTAGFTIPVAIDLPATPPRNSFLDADPGSGERAFYRIELQ